MAMSDYVIEHGGLPLKSITGGIKAASARSGLRCTPNMFRHSAAVWMAEDRVPMAEISQYLGHTNVEITSRFYAKFSPDYLRRAAASLDW
jgi:integrase